ncbi:putative acetyltransferase [Serratia rubidaea]|uniref:Putative acetyltransferase n=1 Tax=Serratia rubidaea TaxID=61652 RepID=A0A3S4I2N6_SERRU|nr:putative acetyltransferase [Serratia rubidaea]
MSVTIRLAQPADIDAMMAAERSAAALFRQLPQWAFIADDDIMSAAQHAALIAEEGVWLAQDGAAIAGFIAVRRDGTEWHIAELSVAAEHQRRGIGRRLIVAVADCAGRQGVRQLTLTTFRNVPWNAPYYQRLGFEIIPTVALSPRLREQMAVEAEYGLPLGSRCAMKFTLL